MVKIKDQSKYNHIDLSKLTFSDKVISYEEALKDVDPYFDSKDIEYFNSKDSDYFKSILQGLDESISDSKGEIQLKRDTLDTEARPD